MKKLLVIISLLLLVGCNNVNKGEIESEDKYIEEPSITKIDCEDGFECESIDNIVYRWSNIEKIKIDKMLNYDDETYQMGSLTINEGKLEFVGLDNKVVRKYDYIEGDVLNILQITVDCEDDNAYALITSKGKIYRSDVHEGVLIEDAFYEVVENDTVFVNVGISYKNEDGCKLASLYGKTMDNKIELISEGD